jgi:adenosine deaminase
MFHHFSGYTEAREQIEIQRIDDFPQAGFDVTVRSNSVTTHRVTLTREYYKKLTADAVTAKELVEETFAFLLARESNTSILPEFDLKVIKKYLSGYEREMQRKFRSIPNS